MFIPMNNQAVDVMGARTSPIAGIMSHPPLWDGQAAKRIVKVLAEKLC
jgi:hypothetical protein